MKDTRLHLIVLEIQKNGIFNLFRQDDSYHQKDQQADADGDGNLRRPLGLLLLPPTGGAHPLDPKDRDSSQVDADDVGYQEQPRP